MTQKIIGFYDIVNFDSTLGKSGFGVYGFFIVLASPAVSELLKVKRDPKTPLNDIVLNRLKESFGVRFTDGTTKVCGSGFEQINYFEDTWLLKGMKVTSNCGCFGFSNDVEERLKSGVIGNINYGSHNIDTLQQATAILSTWLLWFNYAISQTKLELPFAL